MIRRLFPTSDPEDYAITTMLMGFFALGAFLGIIGNGWVIVLFGIASSVAMHHARLQLEAEQAETDHETETTQ